MQHQPENGPTSPLLLFLIVGAVLWFANRGGDGPTPVPPEPPAPGPVEPIDPVKPAEKQVWETLARYVELDRLPTLDTHTHQVVKIADELKAMGYLSDVSRVEPWRTAKREDITAANKSAIISTLKGSP